MKLLLVEDERDLSRSLSKLLKKEAFAVDVAFNGQEALDFLAVADYDAMILDVMLPGLDGFEVLKRLRQAGKELPVLFLTARDQLEDKVHGLDLGADDYLVKPFEVPELLARIKVLLRRKGTTLKTRQFVFGDILVVFDQKQVFKAGAVVDLTAKEFQVLAYLAERPNHICSREQIREALWDFDYQGESNMIDVLVRNIRRKLDDDKKGSIIRTKRGEGYFVQEKE